MKRRCYIKIILELHAVTCPGVWLCTSGYLELTIKTLGYFFKSGPMEPRFPMLCHDIFIIEGYFPSVRNFNELDKVLATENIEVSLWQNGCRLAYFIGHLKQVVYNSYVENSNIQVLMNPSHNFPGIIAPKLELVSHVYYENRSQLDEIQHTCHKFVQMQHNSNGSIPNKTIQTQPDERSPESRIQRPVCHTKCIGRYKEKNKMDWRIPQSCRKCANSNSTNSNDERRSSKETIPSLKFSESSRNTSNETGNSSPHSCNSSDTQHSDKSVSQHSENCDVCRTYNRTFRVSE